MEAMNGEFWSRKWTGRASNKAQRSLARKYGQALSEFKNFHDASIIMPSTFEDP